MQAGYSMGMQPDGRELLVVSIKGTFTIPTDGEEVQLADKQIPLVEADTFTGEPGYSAPVYESDYPPHKPYCDVLLNGSAYAPEGRPTAKVRVFLKIGSFSKTFHVVGNRVWEKGLFSYKPSRPKPFAVMPISYDRAFGGVDSNHKDPDKLKAFLKNPVGCGMHVHLDKEFVEGQPLPNTEELNKPVDRPDGDYKPMSFGPIGRAWQPRVPLAGTYDQNWLDNVFPFLPPDFDERYYQAAPFDQQIPHPQGREPVVLVNLTPEGYTSFQLPEKKMLVWYLWRNGEEKAVSAVMDTIILEPDARRFMLVWRTAMPLKQNMFDVEMVVVGHEPEDRYKVASADEVEFPLMPEGEKGDETKESLEVA